MLQRVTKALRLHVESDSCIVSYSYVLVEAAYSSEEGIDKLGGIWDEVLVILEDRVDCKYCVLSNVGMSVFLLISSYLAIIGATHQT